MFATNFGFFNYLLHLVILATTLQLVYDYYDFHLSKRRIFNIQEKSYMSY
jgi:hypothetical protein